MVTCPEFSPGPDPAICTCRAHWNDHAIVARRAMFLHCEQPVIAKVQTALARDNQFPCREYVPAHDWERGVAAPDCQCGRPRTSHPNGQVIAGIRKWRESHKQQSTPKVPCGQFYGSLDTPGRCSVCSMKWIEHPPKNRGLASEAFYQLHQTWCKCVIMNGDVECSCMDFDEQQASLDGLTAKSVDKKEIKMACKQFQPKSQGNTQCTCGEPFYSHLRSACGGYASFINWRAANMTNKELLEWFQTLPGETRLDRIRSLEKMLADPTFKHVVPSMVTPDNTSLLALLEALDGGAHHRIKVKSHLATEANLFEPPIEATVIAIDDIPLNEHVKYRCHSCEQDEATTYGGLCPDCTNFIAGHSTGPALHMSSDKGGS